MRLVTYNIQFGQGKDGRFDLERIAREVEGADVIAMQEVERYGKRSGLVDQVAALVALLPGYHWVYGPGIDVDASFTDDRGQLHNRRWQFGNLLMSRTSILSARNHMLPKAGLVNQITLQRAALEGVIDCPRGAVRLYSVHLGHVSSLERREQVARLLDIHHRAPGAGSVWSAGSTPSDWPDELPAPPMPREAILLGDFNTRPDSPEYEMIVGGFDEKYGRLTSLDGFVDAWLAAGNDPQGGATELRPDGDVRIDYVFVSTVLADAVRAARVDVEAQGSDHQPLWVEIEL
ncbi:MAG: endonuclease/exonuclease/phosphatase family protein [Acidiferrobacterales bacterium]